MDNETTDYPNRSKLDEVSGINLKVQDLRVELGNKTILAGVSFTAAAGQLTAIIGPNGAGKTTLLRAIAGKRPTAGYVLLNGEDIYLSFEFWLQRIGYVPVENVLHYQLRVEEALVYVGRLRLPNQKEDAIRHKADELLSYYGFATNDPRRQSFIKDLSSGERKRVNICAELLIDPPLLILDEPTSNLDPNAESDLMHRLSEHAHQDQRTVVLVTHTLASIHVCDRVVFVENSRVRVVDTPTRILPKLESSIPGAAQDIPDFDRWANVFDYFKTRPRETTEGSARETEHLQTIAWQLERPSPVVPFWHQLLLMTRRYGRMRLNDRRSFLITLLLGAMAGGFFYLGLPEKVFARPENPSDIPSHIVAARQSVFLLSIVVVLIGLLYAFREITRETPIYLHERLKGLSPLAYLLSKLIWLSAAVGVLVPILILGILWPQQRDEIWLSPSSWLFSGATLILACIAAITLALAVSAMSDNDNTATNYVAIVVVIQALFSGLLTNQKLDDLINMLSVTTVSRWAFEGLSSSWGFYCWSTIKEFKEFDSIGHIASVWAVLTLYILGALGVSVLVLRNRDPWKLPGKLRFGRVGTRPVILFIGVLVVLLSWTMFLRESSYDYYDLTFADKEYGGIRFARIEHITEATTAQRYMGYVSQSQCGEPEV